MNVHPKHHTVKLNSSQLRYVMLASLPLTYLLTFNETLLMAVPLFIYGVKVENCNFIVQHINYFQCSSPVFAMQAFGNLRPKPDAYYTREVLFSPSTAMKSRPVLRIIREI